MKRYAIDFYKSFNLITPACGLVDKITSPKGVRRIEPDGSTSYHLHKELVDNYDGDASVVEPGIYKVTDVFKLDDTMTWCHYLFIIEPDGTTYPIAEFLKQTDSTWIVSVIPLLKRFFAGEDIPSIKLTDIPHPSPRRTRWESFTKK